jgi:ribosomal protein S27AE
MSQDEDPIVARIRCGKCGVELPGWLEKPPENDERAYQRWRLEPCGECGWSPVDLLRHT